MLSNYQEEVIQTNPEVPLGDSFCSEDFDNISQNESFCVSCSEVEETPNRPYFHKLNSIAPNELPRKEIEDKKFFAELTETTDISRGIKKEYVAPSRFPSKLIKTQSSSGYITNKKVLSTSTFLRLSLINNARKKKEEMESDLLKEYWKRKGEIEEKYRKMLADLDKEASVELKYKINTLKDSNEKDNAVNDLSKIKEYYEDSRSLLIEQRIIEQEELLKEFQNQAKI